MLLESAFFKLPEFMMSNIQNRDRVEAMVVHYIASGLQMELDCRSVPFAYNHVFVEKAYPKQLGRTHFSRADILFEASGAIPSTCLIYRYGFRSKQWLEAKRYFSRARPRPKKTQNLGEIVKDIMRLCLLPEELQGNIRQNGRYLLLVFDRHPSKYLASSRREWARELIEKEHGDIKIDFSSEPKTFIRAIAKCDQLSWVLTVSFKRFAFEPDQNEPPPIYWGYLYRIEKWSISIKDLEIEFKGKDDERWGPEKVKRLAKIRDIFLAKVKDDNDV